MSEMGTSETTTESPSTTPRNVSDPHINGHLVYTGMKREKENPDDDEREAQLFIHASQKATNNHKCYIYSYVVDEAVIDRNFSSESADILVEEHGWFRDVAVFEQICKSLPIPDGQDAQQAFFNWRDSLLTFLDTHYSGNLWTRIN